MADSSTELYERKPVSGWQQIMSLPVVICVLLLIGLNCFLLCFKPLAQVDPESLPAAHTWVWWATKEFQELKRAPGVVLLGSSLVMHPVSRMDADFVGCDIDYVKHHRSLYMEEKLTKQLNVPNSAVYNFALPGGMVSDDYMVARSLFCGQRKPSVMVLGLSVRDFIDCGVHCAGATPAFKYLKRYTNIDDLVDIAMPQIVQRFDYWMGKGLYLYGKKLDLQVILSQKTASSLAPIYSNLFAPTKLTAADPERNQPSNLRSEVEEGMMIVKHNSPYTWEDNSVEYKKRYRDRNEKMAHIQFWFLDKLCALAQERNIKVVIVNMPMTPQNHGLMPAGAYDGYLKQLALTASRYGCGFMDLDASDKFDIKDYYDTAHMNSSGGRKLIDSLVGYFSTQQPVVAALKCRDQKQELAGHTPSY